MSQAPAGQNPADFAREAFRQLAVRRIAPTPDNYRDIYNEVAGLPKQAEPAPAPAAPLATADGAPAERMLADFATKLTDTPGDVADFGRRLNRAVAARDWDTYARSLSQLVERPQKKGGSAALTPLVEGA